MHESFWTWGKTRELGGGSCATSVLGTGGVSVRDRGLCLDSVGAGNVDSCMAGVLVFVMPQCCIDQVLYSDPSLSGISANWDVADLRTWVLAPMPEDIGLLSAPLPNTDLHKLPELFGKTLEENTQKVLVNSQHCLGLVPARTRFFLCLEPMFRLNPSTKPYADMKWDVDAWFVLKNE